MYRSATEATQPTKISRSPGCNRSNGPTAAINLDADWFYRRIFRDAIRDALARLAPIDRGIRQRSLDGLRMIHDGLAHHHGEYGILARTWPTGSMVIWVAVVLGLSLGLYYL